MDIQEISDSLEITALLHRYARAVDAKDWALYRSVFTEDAHIDYSSATPIVGSPDHVVDLLSQGFAMIPMAMHYITNIEILENSGDSAKVRAMFYNPMQLPGMAELSYCGGYYHHELTRTADGWRSRHLREESVWFVNGPLGGHAALKRSGGRYRRASWHAHRQPDRRSTRATAGVPGSASVR